MATSRPPSGSRRGSSKPQLPELFCDLSLGRIKVPTRLREVHGAVIAHDDVFRQDTDDSVLAPDLRFADACGELQEGVAQVEFSDPSHAIYTACFVSGTWFITEGPLYVD